MAEETDAFAQGQPREREPILEDYRAVLSWLVYGVQQMCATS